MRGIGVAVMCRTCGRSSPVDALRIERRPLPNAEAVLLVDDRDPRAGANCTASSISAWVPTISDSSPVASLPSRSARRRPGVDPVSSPSGTTDPGISALDRREVLLGERLGRCHQRALVAVLDRPQQRVQRDHGLA